jgi:hypothetical protein
MKKFLKGSDNGAQYMGLLDFWTLSIIRILKNTKEHTFRKLDLFPSSGERWEKYCIQTELADQSINQFDWPTQFGHFSHLDSPYHQ